MLEIGSIGAIKKLVAADVGISFLYREAVIDELAHGELAQIYYAKEKTMREFNFVFLKDSMFEEEYLDFYEFCKAHRAQKSYQEGKMPSPLASAAYLQSPNISMISCLPSSL